MKSRPNVIKLHIFFQKQFLIIHELEKAFLGTSGNSHRWHQQLLFQYPFALKKKKSAPEDVFIYLFLDTLPSRKSLTLHCTTCRIAYQWVSRLNNKFVSSCSFYLKLFTFCQQSNVATAQQNLFLGHYISEIAIWYVSQVLLLARSYLQSLAINLSLHILSVDGRVSINSCPPRSQGTAAFSPYCIPLSIYPASSAL